MKDSPEIIMKSALRNFKKNMRKFSDKNRKESSAWLSDNYYILERCARQAAVECSHARKSMKGSDLLPSLFGRCAELCENGAIPDEGEIVEFLKRDGLDGISAGYLPLAVTCALVDSASKGINLNNEKGTRLLSASIESLRRMGEVDFEFVAKTLSKSEEFLLGDPEGIYGSMDEETKMRYRRAVAVAAFKSEKSEEEIARNALKSAQKNGEHIGKYIIPLTKSSKRGWLFLAMEIVMPLAGALAAGFFFAEPAVAVLLFLPLWELLRYPIERVSLKGIVPKRFLRLSVDDEKVRNTHALLTVSTLLPSADRMNELKDKLESIYLSNAVGNIKVCCLADFKAAGMPRKPEDRHIVKAAKQAVDSLNAKYDGGFILAVRPRSYSETQNEFIGKERKRGAITELVRAVKGNSKGFLEIHGDTENLERVKYLIALDWDTGMLFDSARELVAIAEHPLNRPVIKNGRVVGGYGILVPKAENRLSENSKTYFEHIFSGDSGITAYNSFSCERYQDLFGESIFCGKGLINVDAYYAVLDNALPRESVLSHDIVESGYLRAGFVPDVQVVEDFPKTAGSYFSRLHRWVRGDWQNIRFIFEKNPMNRLSKYKIFDNIRRSLTPSSCLAAVLWSAIIQGYEGIALAVIALFALASRNLYAGFGALINGGFSAVTRLYYSKALPDALGAFVRAFINVAFSAKESFVCLDAVLKAVWRLFVSRNNLLEWTTAAQSENSKKSGSLMLSCLPSVIFSVVVILLGMPIHRLIGIIVLADIPITLFSGALIKHKDLNIDGKQRETLMSYASAIWSFFDEQCGRENNFLPPDNIQFSPARAVTRRTSPTNIGLMLASFLAARDLGLITTAELFMRLNLSLSTVEKLEKYKGNLLNWYSTETLEALTPRFVSTVDSGNFLCCLTAVKQGLAEYASECPRLNDIIDRIERIIEATDLKPMFNERKKLFHIGIDADSQEKSRGCYDLYASEIKMTSYFAVARRLVDKKHWGALGRILVSRGRYTGLASWTGTMFEYFMPNIFLPSPEGSLGREALCFCLQSQRKRAGRRPFGISESGFYAFDGNLNYQYKAHGVQKLGLKRGLDRENVISPYSTFLTLTLAPQISIKNLLRMSKMGATDKYGFYEAIDFTEGRNGGDFSLVRSYMAHHLGMSLLSVDNLLKNQCMQRRFMSDPFMKGAESLLGEKVKTGTQVFKDIRNDEMPHIRERIQGKNTVSENPDIFAPKAAVYSNGRMTVCLSDIGAGVDLFDGVDVTVNSADPISRPQGVFAVFVAENKIIPFVKAIDSGQDTEFRAEFFKDKVEYTAEKEKIKLGMQVKLLKKQNCELREFIVDNSARKKPLKGKLEVYFEPCLEKRESYSSHPAFSKLFLVDEWDEENSCFLFSRRARDTDSVCSVVAGFMEKAQVSHEASREKVLQTPNGVFSVGKKTEFAGEQGNPDCCCAFVIDVELNPGQKAEYTFAIAVEETKEQALDTFLTVRTENNKKFAENLFYGDRLDKAVTENILPGIIYPQLMSKSTITVGEIRVFNKTDLWSFGVSGDLPIILIEISNSDELNCVEPYLKINKILRSCGIATDLVISFESEERYTNPISNAVKNALQKDECILMMGIKGGVHIADLSAHTYEQVCSLKSSASFILKTGENSEIQDKRLLNPMEFVVSMEKTETLKKRRDVKRYNFTKAKIVIEKEPATVDIPWTMVYANRTFGTMVSDKSLGFTWAINSRENKLTPWYSDTMSDNRGEMLILKYKNVLYDIAAIGRAEFTPKKALWIADIDDVEFKVNVSVPEKGMAKKCLVEITNKSNKISEFDLMYYTFPVLGVSRDNNAVFFAKKIKNGVLLDSSGSDIPGFMALECSHADFICLSRQDFFAGSFCSSDNTVPRDCCAAVGRKISLAAGGKTAVEFYLSWGATEKAARSMSSVADFSNRLLNPIEIKTEDANLNTFFNSFLYSQIKQSRFFGRTGFYQCSGAYGFRDQLQDCLAFIEFEPQLAFVHIIRCAAVQFEQGDVLHWWHVIVDKTQKIRGIRTRCSDDMLWLPYACIIYYKKSGDKSIFDVQAPYLKGEELKNEERERYFSPERTKHSESILQHCIKAIDYSLKFGQNGLPLIGACDWNDGYSRIGSIHSGESVWLAMFQRLILNDFAEILEEFNDFNKAKNYKKIAKNLEKAVIDFAWEGDRFSRAFLANGQKLGEDSDFIDVLPQAFAAFSNAGSEKMIEKALQTAYEKLFDSEKHVIRLLSPPFDEQDRESVGYIASYPEGIRENGGQYTHAAVWLAMAMIQIGENQKAENLISSINPLNYYLNSERAMRYRAEPYVLAGDVSYSKSIIGRAGWTHFTGSASWFYRCIYDYAANGSLSATNGKRSKRKV